MGYKDLQLNIVTHLPFDRLINSYEMIQKQIYNKKIKSKKQILIMNYRTKNKTDEKQHLINASITSQQDQYQVYGEPVIFQNQIGYFSNTSNHQLHNNNQLYPKLYNHDSFAADEPQPSQVEPSNSCNDFMSTPTINNEEEHIHTVQHGDTIQGLSLIYSVPIHKIKQRNGIQGDSIFYLKELIIPNPQCIPQKQVRTQQIMIQDFMGHMSYEERSSKTARYYLEQADWDVNQAISSYKADLNWERQNKVKISSIPINHRKGPVYDFNTLQLKKHL